MKREIRIPDKLKGIQEIVEATDKSDIPIKYVRGLDLFYNIPIHGETVEYVDIRHFKENGWSNDEIDHIINEVVKERKEYLKSIHFYLDLESLAADIEKQTNKYLKK